MSSLSTGITGFQYCSTSHGEVTPSPWGYSSAIHACLAGTIAATAESIGADSYNVAGIPHAAWTLFCEAVEQNLVVPPGAVVGE